MTQEEDCGGQGLGKLQRLGWLGLGNQNSDHSWPTWAGHSQRDCSLERAVKPSGQARKPSWKRQHESGDPKAEVTAVGTVWRMDQGGVRAAWLWGIGSHLHTLSRGWRYIIRGWPSKEPKPGRRQALALAQAAKGFPQ